MMDETEYANNGANGRDVVSGWVVYAAVLFILALLPAV